MTTSPSLPYLRRTLVLGTTAGCAAAGLGLALLGRGPVEAAPPPPTSLGIGDMTWPQVRAAIDAGWRTVIIPTGGLEQNGPHMIIAKHDHIVREGARRIAEELGRTLVAPVISFVPEGGWDPPSGNMAFPGTIGVTPAVFEGILEGVARSLRTAGFRAICLIGDHGESQAPQESVARRLDAAWRGEGVRVMQIGAWYRAADAQTAWLKARGETEASIGFHAGIADTAELMAVHPAGVDLARLGGRRGAALAPLGASGDPGRATAETGRAILELRIAAAVAEIKGALAVR